MPQQRWCGQAMANGGEVDGVRLLSAEGVGRAVADPVPNALRNNEAQTNPPLPMGDTAFVAGGFDAFNRRTAAPGTPDFPELHPSIDRRELPPEWHGSDAFGWGGAGGSSIWFNPVENIGLGYAITGFASGVDGFPNRLRPVVQALYEATPALAGAGAGAGGGGARL